MSGAKAIIYDSIPGTPGPPSEIRYWVRVEQGSGDPVLNFKRVVSLDHTFSDEIACMPAPIGSTHAAFVSPAGVSLWITPIPTTVTCEDIE